MSRVMASEDRPQIIMFPPLLWLSMAVASALVHFFVLAVRMLPQPFALVLGIAFVIAGPALAAAAVLAMRAAGTNVDPAKPALTIVRSGPYRTFFAPNRARISP